MQHLIVIITVSVMSSLIVGRQF